jgi:hypothetical protein
MHPALSVACNAGLQTRYKTRTFDGFGRLAFILLYISALHFFTGSTSGRHARAADWHLSIPARRAL